MNPAAGALAPAPGRTAAAEVRRPEAADRIRIFVLGRLSPYLPTVDVVLPLAILSLVSTVGTLAAPVLHGRHPLLLMALSPRLPFLLLAVPHVGFVPFVLIGTVRLCLADPFYFRLGRSLGWLRHNGRLASRLVGHRWARPVAAAAVAVRPNGRHLALAGAVGLRTRVVVVLDVGRNRGVSRRPARRRSLLRLTVPRRIRTSVQRIPFGAENAGIGPEEIFGRGFVRHHRLFAAGLAAALMLGAAATPSLAAGKGKATGKATAPGQKNKPAKPAKPEPGKKAKPVKKSHFGVSGGGSVAGGSFSIQARMRKPSNGHFNYTSTDGKYKVRCKDGWDAPATEPVLAAYPRTMDVTFKNCQITGQPKMNLVVTVTDNGVSTDTSTSQPSVAPVAPVVKDAMRFGVPGPAAADGTATTTTWGGDLVEGNVKIRNK